MNRSPVRVIELCVYALIIMAAVIWLAAGGSLYNAPKMPASVTQTESTESAATTVV